MYVYSVLYSGFTVSKLLNTLTFSTFNSLATNTSIVALVIKITYIFMRLRIIDTQNFNHCNLNHPFDHDGRVITANL